MRVTIPEEISKEVGETLNEDNTGLSKSLSLLFTTLTSILLTEFASNPLGSLNTQGRSLIFIVPGPTSVGSNSI